MTPSGAPQAPGSELTVLALGLGFVLMWSSAFTSARIAVADAPPFLILSARFFLSGAVAVLISRTLGQRLVLNRAGWTALVLFGISQNTLYLGLNFVAMQTIEASLAVVIASALPLTVAAARWLIAGERLPILGILGLAAGSLGVVMFMAARLEGGADPFGILLALVGLAALTLATLMVQGASSGGALLMVVGAQMLVGAVTLLPLSLIFETWEINWTRSLFLAFAYTTIVPGLIATLTWFVLVGRVGATRASSFHFLNPFFGVAIAAAILGEVIAVRDLLGVVVVAVGIWCVQRARHV